MISGPSAKITLKKGGGTICPFKDGCLIGGKDVHVGTATVEQECAVLVKQMNADALGATLYDGKDCYAEYSTLSSISSARYCVFPSGNMILSIEISIRPGYYSIEISEFTVSINCTLLIQVLIYITLDLTFRGVLVLRSGDNADSTTITCIRIELKLMDDSRIKE